VLLAKEETVLQDMFESSTEIGKFYEMEMNMGKAKVIRISRHLSQIQL
jgi:hypothetical protein